jgi:geranylgeranyl reductase
MTQDTELFDVVVVGGGPSGGTAAHDLAQLGRNVLLLDRAGRIKPCGGAIPPRLIRDFDIPDHLLVARINCARMVSPSDQQVDMPIDGGFVGMVDRAEFDEWLRCRAAEAGARRRIGLFKRFDRDDRGTTIVTYEERAADGEMVERFVRTRALIGADGALSAVARQCLPGADRLPYVFAYHEIVRAPAAQSFDGTRCDVYYRGTVSPDFYGWVFPHGDTVPR